MARTRLLYSAFLDRLADYLADGLGHPVPLHANPSDHALDQVNTDFMRDAAEATAHIERIASAWEAYAATHPGVHSLSKLGEGAARVRVPLAPRKGLVQGFKIGLSRTWYLIVRNWINYSRNLLAYGVRLGMYRTHHFP